MRFVYPRTREREVAWKLSAMILLGSLVLSPFFMLIFEPKYLWSFQDVRFPYVLSLPPLLPSHPHFMANLYFAVSLGLLSNS